MVGDVSRFKNLEAISNEAVALLVEKMAGSVMRYLTKKGYLIKEPSKGIENLF
jgi:hypothetical protein